MRTATALAMSPWPEKSVVHDPVTVDESLVLRLTVGNRAHDRAVMLLGLPRVRRFRTATTPPSGSRIAASLAAPPGSAVGNPARAEAASGCASADPCNEREVSVYPGADGGHPANDLIGRLDHDRTTSPLPTGIDSSRGRRTWGPAPTVLVGVRATTAMLVTFAPVTCPAPCATVQTPLRDRSAGLDADLVACPVPGDAGNAQKSLFADTGTSGNNSSKYQARALGALGSTRTHVNVGGGGRRRSSRPSSPWRRAPPRRRAQRGS